MLERLSGEVKRRADVVGIFPNEGAITQLLGAILFKQSDKVCDPETLCEVSPFFS